MWGRKVAVLAAFAAACAAACGGYLGSARSTTPAMLAADPDWVWLDRVPFVRQQSERDCGVAVTSMVTGYWADGQPSNVVVGDVPEQGLTARQVADLLERDNDLEAFVVEGAFADLVHEIEQGRPVVVGLAKPYRRDVLLHYEVVVGVHRSSGDIATVDPAHGWRTNSAQGFALEWDAAGNVAVVAGPLAATGGAEPATTTKNAPPAGRREGRE